MRDYVQMEGSERTPRSGDRIVGRPNPDAVIQVTAHIKAENDQLGQFVRSLAMKPLSERQHLTREEFAAAHGASPGDIAKVRQFAREYGLRVVPDAAAHLTGSNEKAHRTVELRGAIRAFSRAFHVKFFRFEGSDGVYRGYQGAVSLPAELHGVIQNVLGLDTRPQAKPRFRQWNRLGGLAAGGQSYNPDQVAKLYNFPSFTGKGQVIAIVELDGGYRRRDLRKYFKALNIALPSIKSVAVAGGRNAPSGDPNSADGEVMLDIEVAGAVAPDARYVIYFARNTNRGFFRAVNVAVHDDRHKPTILSISWGGPEESWRGADMDSIDQAFQAAAAMGVSVFVAAGDGGSSDAVDPGNAAHVDFPASSPFATACGGTRLQSSDGHSISSETVWNDGPQGGGTGGGISLYFPVPLYQSGLNLPGPVTSGAGPGRAVPDVAGNADPWTGYNVRVDSIDTVVGGTSAVAPLWAGLIALVNEGLQNQASPGAPVGFLNPLLYTQIKTNPGMLHDIKVGNNDTTGLVGGYPAGPGYDACTGLGTPDGAAILNALK